jgi:hypothetical protein
VVTIQEQKINYEYYEIKYVKTRFTTFTNSTWKGNNKPKSHWIWRIITTVNDGEILSTKDHTYRLNSNPCSSHYLLLLYAR